MPINTGRLAVGDRVLLLVFDDKDYRMPVDIDDDTEPPKMAWRMATVTEEIVPLDKTHESSFYAEADDGQRLIIAHDLKNWRWPKH